MCLVSRAHALLATHLETALCVVTVPGLGRCVDILTHNMKAGVCIHTQYCGWVGAEMAFSLIEKAMAKLDWAVGD